MALVDQLDAAQKVVAIAAVLVAGWWFLVRGEGLPRAEIKHEFYSACLNNDVRWLRAIVTVQNVGNVRVVLSKNEHRVAQVFPIETKFKKKIQEGGEVGAEPGRIDWPELSTISSQAENEFLERNETHTQYRDFLLPGHIRVFQVTSFFDNSSANDGDKRIGWHTKSLYDAGEIPCAMQENVLDRQ